MLYCCCQMKTKTPRLLRGRMERMAYAVKISKRVRAWELGAGSDMEREMIRQGKIALRPGGLYELFSQEAPEGKGQVAQAGDFFKVDDKGFPYPNAREFFLREHRRLEGDWYEQAAKPMKIWRKGDPECGEIRFLLDRGLLRFHPEDPEHYFSAFLWDTEERAPEDAVVMFFAVERDEGGNITGVNFNFIVRDYFEKFYREVPS